MESYRMGRRSQTREGGHEPRRRWHCLFL